jgi:Flp pilus assembly protein TadG
MRIQTAANRRRGAAVAEMAILLPFVVFLFLVAVDFCRVFYCTQTIQGCAEAGALYASGIAQSAPGTTPTDAAKQAAVAEGTMLNPPVSTQNVTVSFSGNVATVKVSYQFQMLTGFLGLPQTSQLVRSTQMVLAPNVGDGP